MTLRTLERGSQETTRSIRIHRLQAELDVLEQIPATLLRLDSSDNTSYEARRLDTFVPEAVYEQHTMMDHWRLGNSDFTFRVPLWRQVFKGERPRLTYTLWLREDGAVVKSVQFNTGFTTITTPYDLSVVSVLELEVLLGDLKEIHDHIARVRY